MKKDLSDLNIGLVLAGGGAKGAYQVGVYKALRELEIVENIKVISGTSIGSINALFFAMDDPKVIKESWTSLNYSRFLLNQEKTRINSLSKILEKIKEINIESNIFEQIRLSDIGLLSQTGIKNFIEEYIDVDIINITNKEIYACAYNLDKERPEYFKLNDCREDEIKEIILASCAVPHMFKPIIIDGTRYADGGVQSLLYSKNNVDNTPIYPMKNYDLDIIIVIHLSYKNTINISGFKDTNIIEIYPSSPLEIISGIGTINIKKDTIEHNIELGYRDAMVILAPIIVNLLKNREIEGLVNRNKERNKNYLSNLG
ncbi:MAG: patatin-like phospholipase family protein [Clostridium sartagoforme]|nr:patatin-like phospholipase family protein [Clostridium sartagoforme]